MAVMVLVARVGLGGLLVIAGALKAADLDGTRSAIRSFGVRERLAAPAARLLPALELLVGSLIVLQPTAAVGAALAAALMGVFALGTSLALARGRRPDCHCFGRLHPKPTGWSTVARNVLLSAVGLVVVGAGGGRQLNPLGWLGAVSALAIVMSVAAAVLAAVLGLQAWFTFHLLRQNGRILRRIETLEEARSTPGDALSRKPARQTLGHHPSGLAVGTAAPDFTLPRVDGATMALGRLLDSGRPLVLIFADPNCEPCNAFLPRIAEWQHRLRSDATVAVVSRGRPDASKADELSLENILVQTDREVARAYLANATPSAVLIDTGGRIGSPVAVGAQLIEQLLAAIAAEPSQQESGIAHPAGARRTGALALHAVGQ